MCCDEFKVPKEKIDVVLDTDAYNEVDDQWAIAYLLRSDDRLNLKEIYTAPFFNRKSTSAEDGMLKSYDEILKILDLADRNDMKDKVYKGSTAFLTDEKTPVISDSANRLARLAEDYSPENPLYVVAIGAITNIASALLINPEIAKNLVIVWLGGHSHDFPHTKEFNMFQDIAAARVVFLSDAKIVQLPCGGVVDTFHTTEPELRFWLSGKNKLCDYLVENTVKEAESYAHGKPWSRIIWDVTAVAYLLNDDEKFMNSRMQNVVLPGYVDYKYSDEKVDKKMCYVYHIKRDAIFEDMFEKLKG